MVMEKKCPGHAAAQGSPGLQGESPVVSPPHRERGSEATEAAERGGTAGCRIRGGSIQLIHSRTPDPNSTHDDARPRLPILRCGCCRKHLGSPLTPSCSFLFPALPDPPGGAGGPCSRGSSTAAGVGSLRTPLRAAPRPPHNPKLTAPLAQEEGVEESHCPQHHARLPPGRAQPRLPTETPASTPPSRQPPSPSTRVWDRGLG